MTRPFAWQVRWRPKLLAALLTLAPQLIAHGLVACMSLVTFVSRLLALLGVSAVAAMAAGATMPKYLAGNVVDADTGRPLEGAYVLAGYHVLRSGPAATHFHCVTTRGFVTGADGTFRFLVEKDDGMSPHEVSATAPGYHSAGQIRNDGGTRTVRMRRQDPTRPVFYGNMDSNCDEARTREDAAAAVRFLEIEVAERSRYGAPQYSIDAGRRMIDRLRCLPPEAEPDGGCDADVRAHEVPVNIQDHHETSPSNGDVTSRPWVTSPSSR